MMSLIARFEIETPVLRAALEAAPEMLLRTEALHSMRDEPPRAVVWAWGGDFGAFERALDTDPTIADHEPLAEVGDRRLYRVTVSEAGERVLTYPVAAEHDVVLLDLTGSREGLEIRARFPARDALIAYRDACRERDVAFHLHELHQERRKAAEGGPGEPYGVTEPQHEALLHALERGYFDVPRRTTLAEVADDLGISTQALSTRLRRGQENLVRNTLAR